MAPSLRISSFLALLILVLASLLAQPGAAQNGDQAADDQLPNLRATGLILVKVYCLIIIFFATFLPGVSPYFLRWNATFLVLGIQFAAGIFLATAMLHFLGDSTSTFETLTTNPYPFSYMLAVSGYFLTMLADLIVQYVYSRQPVSHRPPLDLEASNVKGGEKGGLKDSVGQPDIGEEGSNEQIPEVQNLVKATLIHKASVGDALLLMLALCFHSVFEGIAIGVASTKADAWKALWTISLHKVFAAISMGIALLRMVPDRPLLSVSGYSFAFAISSPVGVAIGLAIDSTTEGSTADWIYAISMGFAAGVFIYVAINHLIAKGYVPESKVALDRPGFKYIAFVLGCGVMFVAMIWDT
ncbi:unnamed protein product [Calypogeia fissa]